jgi:hypothetical protein
VPFVFSFVFLVFLFNTKDTKIFTKTTKKGDDGAWDTSALAARETKGQMWDK